MRLIGILSVILFFVGADSFGQSSKTEQQDYTEAAKRIIGQQAQYLKSNACWAPQSLPPVFQVRHEHDRKANSDLVLVESAQPPYSLWFASGSTQVVRLLNSALIGPPLFRAQSWDCQTRRQTLSRPGSGSRGPLRSGVRSRWLRNEASNWLMGIRQRQEPDHCVCPFDFYPGFGTTLQRGLGQRLGLTRSVCPVRILLLWNLADRLVAFFGG